MLKREKEKEEDYSNPNNPLERIDIPRFPRFPRFPGTVTTAEATLQQRYIGLRRESLAQKREGRKKGKREGKSN
jgi:hypothetical protein